MARGKKTPIRPRRSASVLQASSEAISSQPDRPSSAASGSTRPALLLPAGSQPTPANQPDATRPAASQPDATQPAASQPPSEAVASTGEIDSETSGTHYISSESYQIEKRIEEATWVTPALNLFPSVIFDGQKLPVRFFISV